MNNTSLPVDPTSKQRLVAACRELLAARLEHLQALMRELSEAASGETKSTAGDKHETGRAMMQLEQEKTGRQLQEAEQQLSEFERIDFQRPSGRAATGSLVQTDRGLFLIGVSAGKLTSREGQQAFAISPQSPLGKALMGAEAGASLSFSQVNYQVLAIL